MRKKVLALDYGTKRIGIASGDTESKMAFPKGLIENKGPDFVLNELEKIVNEWEVDMFVIGLPLNMNDDEKNDMQKEVDRFGKLLSEKFGKEVILHDERLSTFEAEDLMRKLGKSDKDIRGVKDEIAAQIILQRFFDSTQN